MSAADRPATLPEAFQRTARIAPDAVALRTVGGSQTMTWRDYAARVWQVAAGLAALGVGRGDTVSLMMANRIEFYPLEVGAQHVGATSFSVYNTLAADHLADVFANAANKLVFCEHQYVDRIKAGGAPIDRIVCVDGSPEKTISVDDLITRGSADFDFEAAWQAVQPDDVATLIHTSGTTGDPKAVEITHTSLLFEVFGLDEVLGLQFGDLITSFLPTAHTADRVTALYIQEVIGAQVTVVPDIKTITAALSDVRPTVWGGMPRVWETMKAGIEAKVGAETGVKKALGDWALGEANTRAQALLAGSEPGVADRLQYTLADNLVLGKLRAGIGLDRARWLISGDAPIPEGDVGLLCGPRPPDDRGLGHVRTQRYRDREPPTRRCVGFRREAAAGPGDQSGRRWRVLRSWPAGHEGLPQRAREDRRGHRRRWVAAYRGHRHSRRWRQCLDYRP